MLTETEKQAVRDRMQASIYDNDVLRLYDVLTNNENKISRQAFKDVRAFAPAVSAPEKAWRAYLLDEFPELAGKLQERQSARNAETGRIHAEYERRNLESLANSKTFKGGETLLGWMQKRKDEGFTPEASGVGCARLVKGTLFYKGKRDAAYNAAIKLVFPEFKFSAPNKEARR